MSKAHFYSDSSPRIGRDFDVNAQADTKPTNPKQAVGEKKAPMSLVPAVMVAEAATAFAEGSLKYGTANWRVAGVRASTYYSALLRHVGKWWNGQDRDPATRVRHLANALACIGILLDAEMVGKLTDDRPPAADAEFDVAMGEIEKTLAHLQSLYGNVNPRNYTIADKISA